jgi:hypothetical protein
MISGMLAIEGNVFAIAYHRRLSRCASQAIADVCRNFMALGARCNHRRVIQFLLL